MALQGPRQWWCQLRHAEFSAQEGHSGKGTLMARRIAAVAVMVVGFIGIGASQAEAAPKAVSVDIYWPDHAGNIYWPDRAGR